MKGDSTESGGHSTNPFFDEEDDIDDESESDVGWPTEHPVKRKNERRGSRMKEDGAAAASAASAASAAAGIASEKDIMLPEWLIELPEDLEVLLLTHCRTVDPNGKNPPKIRLYLMPATI